MTSSQLDSGSFRHQLGAIFGPFVGHQGSLVVVVEVDGARARVLVVVVEVRSGAQQHTGTRFGKVLAEFTSASENRDMTFGDMDSSRMDIFQKALF